MQELQKAADDEGLVGIGFISNVARSYPMSNVGSGFASQFIGTAANDGNTLVGSDGIELAYNSILSGKNGVETYQKDASVILCQGQQKLLSLLKMGLMYIRH